MCAASGVIERWELLRAQSRRDQRAGPPDPRQLAADLDDITSWLERVIPALEGLQQAQPAFSVEDMAARAKELKVLFEDKYNRCDERSGAVCVYVHGVCLAGDAQALRSLQVRHAGGQPGSSGNPRTAGQSGQDEPKLESSLHRPPAVGHQSEEDSDALPG